MTATRDRRSDPELDAELAWDDRPIIGQFRGLPWWAAVLLAFGLTAIAAFVDMQRQDTLGKIYQGAFVVGCVSAICIVRRRNLFGPMVQPPLVFAVTAVGAVALLSPTSSGSGVKALILSVALPLTSNFPTMGITTAGVVGIGLFRLWRERDPNPEMRPNKPPKDRGSRGADPGFGDEPGQNTGGRGLRGRADKASADERSARQLPDRGPRPPRDAGSRDASRNAGREQGRRGASATGRGERGRAEPPPDNARGRGRGRGGDPAPRRREPGVEGGRARDERGGGRRDSGRDGRQPRRRPPEDYR